LHPESVTDLEEETCSQIFFTACECLPFIGVMMDKDGDSYWPASQKLLDQFWNYVVRPFWFFYASQQMYRDLII